MLKNIGNMTADDLKVELSELEVEVKFASTVLRLKKQAVEDTKKLIELLEKGK